MGVHPLEWLERTAYELLRWTIDLGPGAIQTPRASVMQWTQMT